MSQNSTEKEMVDPRDLNPDKNPIQAADPEVNLGAGKRDHDIKGNAKEE